MNRKFLEGIYFFLLPFLLSGCDNISNKSTNMTWVYAVTVFISLLLLLSYLFTIRKKEKWFIVLFVSVFVVNCGYFMLSVSDTLNLALWANRLSYLGSVFLPLSMLMNILNMLGFNYKKWLPAMLLSISALVFLIAASPGYLDIYYKSVTLENINGVSVLNKQYGPWHTLYYIYLAAYFSLMILAICNAMAIKKTESALHSFFLIVAVFVNICVWLLEQFVKFNFEFLSISYIISELFMISVYLMLQNHEKFIESLRAKTIIPPLKAQSTNEDSLEFIEHCKYIAEQLPLLTPTETAIYNCYLSGKGTKEVLKEMSISENTLKFHNKNIYSKLGVSSRKQLVEYAKAIEASSN